MKPKHIKTKSLDTLRVLKYYIHLYENFSPHSLKIALLLFLTLGAFSELQNVSARTSSFFSLDWARLGLLKTDSFPVKEGDKLTVTCTFHEIREPTAIDFINSAQNKYYDGGVIVQPGQKSVTFSSVVPKGETHTWLIVRNPNYDGINPYKISFQINQVLIKLEKRSQANLSQQQEEILIQSPKGILCLAKNHYKVATEHIKKKKLQLLDYGKRWGEFIERMKNAIMQFHSFSEALDFAEKKVNFTHRINMDNVTLSMYEWQLIAEFPQFEKYIKELPDSPLFRGETIVEINGIKKSNILYYYMHTLFACLTHLKDLEVVAEIGPGFGELARLWMINGVHTPKNYILIDAPESLFFADLVLSAHFGPEAIYYISSNDVNIDELKKHQFIFCPVQYAYKLEKMPIDLVINTGSMQEMSEDWVDFWMNWLDKANVKFLYSLNYFAQDIANMAEGGNSLAPRLSKKWIHRIQRSNPYWIRLQTERNYGEILAEKVDKSNSISAEDLQYGRRLLTERYMDGTVLMEVLDLYRRSKDPTLGYELLVKATQGLNPLPKELDYLVDQLIKDTASFSKKDLTQLNTIRNKIKKLREQGNEGFAGDQY